MHRVRELIRRVRFARKLVHEGARLARLDPDGLNRSTGEQYGYHSQYHEDDYNLSGLHDWEQAAIDARVRAGSVLVVAAAGGGREVIGLARAGYDVFGFDCSATFVDLARRLLESEGLSATMVLSEPDRVSEQTPACDGAIVGWGGWMHIPTRGRRVRFLQELSANVKPGGLVLLSFVLRKASPIRYAIPFVVASALCTARGAARTVERGDTLFGSFDHHFSRREAESEVTEAGLEIARFIEQPFAHIIARKPG